MSFDTRFDQRWSAVIEPAITDVEIGGESLTAHRIDLSRRGDSVLTEILDEIARARLVIADITTIGTVQNRPVRNANVMYEVGLAHAVRLPEEVILLRSDDDPLPFDVANVRVHSFNPEQEHDASTYVGDLIMDALRSIDSARSQAVRRTCESLDFESWDVLYDIAAEGEVTHPSRDDVTKRLGLWRATARIAAIQRLLELGAIETQYQRITPQHVGGYSELPKQALFQYRMTPFGHALLNTVLKRIDFFRPEIDEAFNKLAGS
jgi:hypothetical protein